jgi:DNA-binding transcriptional regulator YdaS (Cro superfamily)
MNPQAPFDPVPVRAAVACAIALKGSEQKLAAACGVTQPAIWRAKTHGRVSPRLALAIHRATDGAVPASTLRPDLWRRPQDAPVDAAPDRRGGDAS